MENTKELKKYLESKNNNIDGSLYMTLYTKGSCNNWYCDAYYFDGEDFANFTTKATGYGYDKQSTACSNAINVFKNCFKRYGKTAKKYKRYGLYDDNVISYGIGLKAVINCVECFKNVKIIEFYEGKKEISLKIKINRKEDR